MAEGSIFQSTSDSEVILHLVARSRKGSMEARFIDALSRIEGGYALLALTNECLLGARDPLGIRPLVLGELDGAYVLASETCRAGHDRRPVRARTSSTARVVVISGQRTLPLLAPLPRGAWRGPACSNTSTSPVRTRW